ncbi:MAG: hypothetical protein FJ388_16010 [Verrucomicrobia bacterium]|nr:hypothetical protein [Verrucomicrobiota bacterium]
MKLTDDYAAKVKIWARESKVRPLPPLPRLPRFGAKKFSSYAEFNAWKLELLKQIAAESEP